MIFHREHFLPPSRARKVTDEFVKDLPYDITIVYFLSARYYIESNLVSTAHYKHYIIYYAGYSPSKAEAEHRAAAGDQADHGPMPARTER